MLSHVPMTGIFDTFVTCGYLPCCMNNALVLILAICPPLSDCNVAKVKGTKSRHVTFPWLVYAWQADGWLVSGQYHSFCVAKCSGCGNTTIPVTTEQLASICEYECLAKSRRSCGKSMTVIHMAVMQWTVTGAFFKNTACGIVALFLMCLNGS